MRTYVVYIWQIEGVALENCMGMGRYGAKLVNICHRSVVEKIPEDRDDRQYGNSKKRFRYFCKRVLDTDEKMESTSIYRQQNQTGTAM